MDRRYFVALLFSLLILLVYPHYLRWVGVTPSGKTSYQEVRREPVLVSSAPKEKPPGANQVQFQNKFYEAVFSNVGGTIELLKQGDTLFYKSGPGEKGIFGVRILQEAQDLSQEIFQLAPSQEKGGAPQFVYEKPGEYRLAKKFFMANDRPSFVMEIELENLSDRERHFPLQLEYGLHLEVHDRADETKVKILRFLSGEVQTTHMGALRKKPLVTSEALEWHGLTKKYYALLVKPDFTLIGQETRLQEEELMSTLQFSPLTLAPGEKKQIHVLVYAGPEQYERLKELGFGFEKIFSSGTLGILRIGLLRTLKFFYRISHNYGVAILLLTLLIKLLFTPFTHMSYQSMQKMQALQPKIRAFQTQHKNDPARLNKELMELYRRNRVNPMMGCLPLVLQIPIFIAFYQVLSEAVELKGAGFIGWIKDLSIPDRIFSFPVTLPFVGDSFNFLPILMIGSMLWQQKLTPQTAADPMQAKIMYLTPLIFGFVFYSLPSGLVLYWIANNLLTIFHQLFIKRIPIILHHEDA